MKRIFVRQIHVSQLVSLLRYCDPLGRAALLTLALLLGAGSAWAQDRQEVQAEEPEKKPIDEITIIEKREPPSVPTVAVPRTFISAADAAKTNVTTTEDFLSYQPSIIIRRRFIGDTNGTMGMRGSNMFQTTRSMVFADGLPLHYMLQTQFSGAPRWGLVSPDEVSGVEVLYGPFSAEYGGGSMGGVVNFQTELPQEQKIHIEGGTFLQDYDFLGTSENYGGRRVQGSYGNKLGNLSFSLSSEHLFNEGQPMTFFSANRLDPPGGTPVTGSRAAQSATSVPQYYFGDTGAEDATATLTKLRLGYGMGDWLARFTVGYEDRQRALDNPTSYLRDGSGQRVFSGLVGVGNDSFQVPTTASPFDVSHQDRRSVLVGGALDGPLTENWNLELDFSVFDLLQDQQRSRPLQAPTGAGTLTRFSEFKDTGWVTGDAKLRTQHLAGREGLSLVTGYHYEQYSLATDDLNINNVAVPGSVPPAFTPTRVPTASGGKSYLHALFAQGRWDFMPGWDLQLGLRAETWQSKDGFRTGPSVGALSGEQAGRRESALSPKFALGFAPAENWQLRYSVARAVRFPIVEELFRNQSSNTSATISDPSLKPEQGWHQDFMVERQFDGGYVRANLYRETIRDVIFSQLALPGNVTTFLPIGEQVVNGAELVAEMRNLMDSRFDVSANLSFADARIVKNPINTAFERKIVPRMPKYRGNLMLTYHMSPSLDLSAGYRFASDSFGALDNLDEEDGVFGAQDAYQFVNMRLNYRMTERSRLSFGVDNIFGEKAFVFHPWPMRTFFVEYGADL